MARWTVIAPAVVAVVALSGALTACAAVPLPRTVKTDYDAVVVGSGMGGLSAAAHLANGGMKVLVLEQHFKVGGCTSSFVRGDYAFDTALHEMSAGGGERGFVFDLMNQVGVFEKVEPIRVPELGRSIFPGLEIVHPDGVEAFEKSLIAQFPAERKNIEAYMDMLENLATEMAELRGIYLGNPVKALLMKMAVPLRQRTLTKYSNNTVREVMDDFFEDEKLKAVLSQFWSYYGPPPDRLWAVIFFSAQYSYLKNGGWQFRGSSSSLAVAYAERIRELGGTVRTAAKVTSINLEDERVKSVTTADGRTYTTRYVVSNADPFQTFYKLIGEEHTPRSIRKKLEKMVPSDSLTGVYLGLDVDLKHFGIQDYEIFYNTSWDHEAMHRAMLEGRFREGMVSMTFYSNLGDDFYAPTGRGAMVLHAYSSFDYWSKDPDVYERQKHEMMDALIDVAEKVMPDLRGHIVYSEGMTPRTIQSYTLNYKGAPYGMDFTVDQRSRMDIETGIAGLYLAGSWAFPAHSVAMAQVSGYLASQLILRKDGR